MASPKQCERDVTITDEAVIRAVLPRNGPKLLARLVSVPVETARHWYYRHLSQARTRELALALLAEMDTQDRHRAELRAHLHRMADDKAGGVLAGEAVQPDRGADAGSPSSGVGGAVDPGAPVKRGRG